MKQNKNKSASLLTKILLSIAIPVIIFCLCVYILNASTHKSYSYNPLILYFQIKDSQPMIEDTNVESIKIKEIITVGNQDFYFSSLDIGDNYSVINYIATEGTDYSPLSSAKLYQNGNLLPYMCAASSSFDGNAIGYASAEGYEDLELHINIIKEKTHTYYTYPIVYSGESINVDVTIQGISGVVNITHDDSGYIITTTGLECLESKKEWGNSHPVIYSLYANDETIHEYSQSQKPDTLKITVVDVIYEGDTIILPIS